MRLRDESDPKKSERPLGAQAGAPPGNCSQTLDTHGTLSAQGGLLATACLRRGLRSANFPLPIRRVGYPFDSGDHNILWLAIGGPRKGLPIAPRFQACDGHGACVILDRPETQPRGPIACRPASGAPGCILGAVCWRPWIDQTTTPRGYLSQVDTPLRRFVRIIDTFPHGCRARGCCGSIVWRFRKRGSIAA